LFSKAKVPTDRKPVGKEMAEMPDPVKALVPRLRRDDPDAKVTEERVGVDAKANTSIEVTAEGITTAVSPDPKKAESPMLVRDEPASNLTATKPLAFSKE
jgi:hypothetical protein